MKQLILPVVHTLNRMMRFVKRRRRLIAALLLCAAAASAVNQLVPGNQFTALAITVNRDLPAGSVIKAEQLTLSSFPPSMVPAAALTQPSQAIGQLLTAAVRKGQMLTDASLLGSGLLVGAPPGSVAVPLHIADPQTISWLRAGQLVNVLLSVQEGSGNYQRSQLLAKAVPVLWLPTKSEAAPGILIPGTMGGAEMAASGLVLVCATADQSTLLASAATRGKLSLVLTSG